MEYRKLDYNSDVNDIVVLIRENLDPNFTLDFFKWKHLDNPFGQSFGLLALDEGKIIGLRMFMRWEFVDDNGEIVSAVRPVDTVTELKYRGRGIFKELTLRGLSMLQETHQLIFNTPNKNSLPGYLKMGWHQVQSPNHFKIGFINPIGKKFNFRPISSSEIRTKMNAPPFFTNKSEKYLEWRYKSKGYKRLIFDDGTYVIFKLLQYKGVPAILLFEVIENKEPLAVYLRSIAIFYKRFLVYYYENEKFKSASFLLSFKGEKAVIVSKDDEKGISGKISYNLGELEGIL